jgi:adenylate cyclase class 2
MKYEVEQKFPLADANRVRELLAEHGAHFSPAILQVDRYFNHPQRDFASTDEALRIRTVGESNCVTYKGPKIDTETKTRRELELPIEASAGGAERFAQLLQVLSFREVASVTKRRSVAQIGWCDFVFEVALDEVEGLGRYIEIETEANDEELARAKESMQSLAEYLGLANSEQRGYLDLLLA